MNRLRTADKGVAAVEFAVLLPFMLFVYVGSTELSQAMMSSRKASVIARSLADLVSQQPINTDLTAAQLDDIFTGAAAIMAPFPGASLKMTVSSVEFAAKTPPATGYDARTKWTVAKNGGALRACGMLSSAPDGTNGGTTTIPAGLYGPGSIIVADVAYVYTPSFGGGLLAWSTSSSSVQMRRTMFMRPRVQDSIRYAGTNGVICY
jgi:Flp pilus assembly protein TadG